MSHYKKNCVFCKVAKRKIEHFQFWEDKKNIAFLDRQPTTFGHALVIPKDHVSYIFNLHQKEYSALFVASEKIAKALQKLTKCKRVGLIVSGFAVPHTHIHLLPMNNIAEATHKIKKPSKEKMLALTNHLVKILKD